MSRSNYAHQLSVTASSDLGSQVVCQAQVQDLNTGEDRQHHSSSIYKQLADVPALSYRSR